MDFNLALKGGFLGFAICFGALILVFFVCGTFLGITARSFVRVFTLAAVVSFGLVYGFLHLKIVVQKEHVNLLFLAGTVGGWLAGITSGLLQLKPVLTRLLKR
ncbi:MAG: hypothetical protein AB1646_25265 [Thermodesulfobacteriota bacterium]